MLRRLYDWILWLAETRHALWALAAVSFVESSVFPIPPDVMLIPMVIARPDRAFFIAFVCTAASVAGGVAGYLIGYGLFETLGQPILTFYGYTHQFESFAARYNEYGAWAVLFAGVTPFPYKVITILSGSTGLNFWVFMISSIVARALRFFVIAALLWKFGPAVRDFIDRRFGLVSTASIILLFAGFAAIKLFS